MEVNRLLQAVLETQAMRQESTGPESQAHYQKAWDRFRAAYIDYHQLIKQNFVRIRDLVAKAWSARIRRNAKKD
jgi:hypothetical protein